MVAVVFFNDLWEIFLSTKEGPLIVISAKLAGATENASLLGAGYDTKLHLMGKHLFWSFGQCGVLLHCHYSQVHFNMKW